MLARRKRFYILDGKRYPGLCSQRRPSKLFHAITSLFALLGMPGNRGNATRPPARKQCITGFLTFLPCEK